MTVVLKLLELSIGCRSGDSWSVMLSKTTRMVNCKLPITSNQTKLIANGYLHILRTNAMHDRSNIVSPFRAEKILRSWENECHLLRYCALHCRVYYPASLLKKPSEIDTCLD